MSESAPESTLKYIIRYCMNRLAILMMVHDHFDQFIISFDSIYNKEYKYIIHCDPKANKKLKDIVYKYSQIYSNIYLLHPLESVYGSWGQVENVLRTIRYLSEHEDWDTLIWCSGQCLPLYNIKEIESKLELGYSYIETKNARESWWDNISNRLSYIYIPDLYLNNIKKTDIEVDIDKIYNFPIYAGSDWGALSKDAALYLISRKNTPMRRLFSLTFAPGEIFYATSLMNSIHKDKVINIPLFYCKWEDNGSHTKILKELDYEDILKSKDKGYLFARKFNISEDVNIINKVILFQD